MNDLKINIPTTPPMAAASGITAAPSMPAPSMPAAPASVNSAAPASTTPTPAPASIAVPELDLDALLSKIQAVKPTATGTRKSSVLVTNTAEGIKNLVEKATAAGIDRLPWSTVIRQTAIALGITDKKSQYYYTLGQSVLKVLESSLKIYKEGRKTFIACAGEIPAVTEVVSAPEEVTAPVQA